MSSRLDPGSKPKRKGDDTEEGEAWDHGGREWRGAPTSHRTPRILRPKEDRAEVPPQHLQREPSPQTSGSGPGF